MPVPSTVRTKFPAIILFSFLGPSVIAPTSAPIPAVMCTTIPPAKSNTPAAAIAPFGPQTM